MVDLINYFKRLQMLQKSCSTTRSITQVAMSKGIYGLGPLCCGPRKMLAENQSQPAATALFSCVLINRLSAGPAD